MLFMQKLVVSTLLIALSSFTYAQVELRPINNRLHYPLNNYNENGVRAWKPIGGGPIIQEYSASHDKNLKVRSVASNAVSRSTVPATINVKVPKSTVFQNLFANAKKGGKFLARGGWYGLAFSLVVGYLLEEGWTYDEEKGNWVKNDEDNTFAIVTSTKPNIPTTSMTRSDLEDYCNKNVCQIFGTVQTKDGSVLTEKQKKVCSKLPQVKDMSGKLQTPNMVYRNQCAYGGARGVEAYTPYYINAVRLIPSKTEMSQNDFNRIIEPIADADPTDFVEKSRPSENEPVPGVTLDDVSVPDGTIAQTDPYTNPKTGTVEQTRWDFGRDGQGKTTVTETVTPRPDLNPNSPEAPKLDTPPDNPTDNSASSVPKNNEPLPESDLCQQHPDILACQGMGEMEDTEQPFNIPMITNPTAWQPDNFLPTSATCPASKTTVIMGKTYEFTYDWLCQFAEQIKYLMIAIASIMAGYIVLGRKE